MGGQIGETWANFVFNWAFIAFINLNEAVKLNLGYYLAKCLWLKNNIVLISYGKICLSEIINFHKFFCSDMKRLKKYHGYPIVNKNLPNFFKNLPKITTHRPFVTAAIPPYDIQPFWNVSNWVISSMQWLKHCIHKYEPIGVSERCGTLTGVCCRGLMWRNFRGICGSDFHYTISFQSGPNGIRVTKQLHGKPNIWTGTFSRCKLSHYRTEY